MLLILMLMRIFCVIPICKDIPCSSSGEASHGDDCNSKATMESMELQVETAMEASMQSLQEINDDRQISAMNNDVHPVLDHCVIMADTTGEQEKVVFSQCGTILVAEGIGLAVSQEIKPEGPRKARVASMGVVVLLNEIKAKKKDHSNKAKSSVVSLGSENYDSVEGGRLWILWRKNLLLTVLRKCDQAIIIFVRRGLWDHLKIVENDMGSSSWVIGGDFKITARAKESSDFEVMGVHFTPDMKEMLDFPESFVEFKAQGVSVTALRRIEDERTLQAELVDLEIAESEFYRGRNIVDNTLLSQEIVKGYSRRSLSPREHRDPLSPYLFVIAMNVLYFLLDAAAKQGIFKFHPKCKRVPLTHFALLGHLPVRYLGVPLVTRKLTSKDYATLLARSRTSSTNGQIIILASGDSDTPARGARVGWNQVCSLKSEGGLGLRNLVVWSRACCLLLVRNILDDEGSLWIAWIKEYCFKSVSYWEVDCKPHFSWILTKLLKLREEARRLLCPYANWNSIKGKWIWDNIRDNREKVAWHRLDRFGVIVGNVCGLCGTGVESRDHLFADCSYTKGVWGAALCACSFSYVARTWDEHLHWMLANLKGKTLRVRVLKLAWTGFLYLIWEERNHRHHRNLIRSVDVIVNRLMEAVKIKLYRHRCIELRM
ncbi:hypothetical protein F3Y22_tig00111783pilonHSYRG00557 [Hibiscus syriacus]|uniref:Reverse transcriptase zinc-binding domain-containing protein n=1 Tax=Hibiscus syriacus TaxID=106335 RepID=A0A6A2XCY7_HIBSY|nr:hypothetical protein F3Y22_tig00111783pilonHSYRG00557 [Hibiscus syriacus]